MHSSCSGKEIGIAPYCFDMIDGIVKIVKAIFSFLVHVSMQWGNTFTIYENQPPPPLFIHTPF